MTSVKSEIEQVCEISVNCLRIYANSILILICRTKSYFLITKSQASTMLRFHDADNIWRFMYCMKFIKEIFEKVKQRSSEVLLNNMKTI